MCYIPGLFYLDGLCHVNFSQLATVGFLLVQPNNVLEFVQPTSPNKSQVAPTGFGTSEGVHSR